MRLLTLDANILIYAIHSGERRQAAALSIVQASIAGRALITIQALGEFFAVSTRKRIATVDTAAAGIERWTALFGPPVGATPATLTMALREAQLHRFSFWDAMLLATAEAAGCTAIISEDMAPGARLGRIRVVPAFAGDAVSPEAAALLA